MAMIFQLNAQQISGVVVRAEDTNEPLEYAHVNYSQLNGEGKAVQKMVLTNERGNAENPFSTSSIIRVSHMGYLALTDTLEDGEFKEIFLQADVEWLEDIVVTAQYAPTSAEKAVHSIKVVDRKKMDALGAVNLRDVLTNETNIRISQDNVLGSSTSVQGLSGQNVKVLIDGVPVIGRLGGDIDLSQINLNTIERIEIVEGPLSVEYGTNALAGTINLISKKTNKENYSIGINSYYESAGQYNLDGNLQWRHKKSIVDLSGGRNYFDGWTPGDRFFKFPKSRPADFGRTNQWNPKEQFFGKARIIQNIKDFKLGFTSSYFKETIKNLGAPRLPYFETAFDDYYHTRRIDHSLNLDGKIGDKGNMQFILAHNRYRRIKNTYFIDLTSLEDHLTDVPGDQDTTHYKLWMLRGTYNSTAENSRLNFSLGFDINIEEGTGARIKEGKQEIGDYAFFGSVEYSPLEELTIRPGLRYSYNSAYVSPITPAIYIKWVLDDYIFRATYSRGFRAPSVKDLYFDFVDINHNIQGNPDLKAERSHNYSFGLSWSKTQKKSVYKLGGTLFYNDIDDLINLAQGEESTFTYFNLDQFKTWGLKFRPEWKMSHFMLGFEGAYVGRYNSLSEDYDVDVFNYSHELSMNASYELKKHQMQFSVFYKYNGELRGFFIDENDRVAESMLASYQTLDISVSKKFLKNSIHLTIGAKNLFDIQNIQSSGAGDTHSSSSSSAAMSWGRTVFTSLNFWLDKNTFK